MGDKWIQRAIKKPGALTDWFKKNRSRLKRLLGYDPITKRGDINDRALYKTEKLIKSGKLKVKNKTLLLRRINLAQTLSKLRKKRR